MPDPVSYPHPESTVVACKAGEFLFLEGERHASVFVIETGQVELLRAADRGAERLALLGPGDVLGEDAAFGRRASGCSARAVADSRVVKVAGDAFKEVLRVSPEVGSRVIASLGNRLYEARVACITEAPAAAAAPAPIAVTGGAPDVADQRPGGLAATLAPRLTHPDSGASFPLAGEGEAVVGRADPRTRFRPDIELSSVDTERCLSRRHAVISREGGQFFVTEQARVANGTFVNGQRLKAGEPKPIGDGDEVCFGLVRTVFRTT